MMIEAENLSKKYRLGNDGVAPTSLREVAGQILRRPLSVFSKNVEKEFYALKDVSFSVRAGETVGIVGRNGSGKSTLLKILSRITYPTSGRAALYGRFGSLLEVGAGFNYELTGRENVYLGGATLGMPHRETARKFDRIIEFAGVERFVDTPVKHYSSGMFMRLAFAVAAHVEPEILFLDEILAVGDFEFQQRCFAKIRELATRGQTILLVTHDLQRMPQICSRAIWLENGRIKMDDSAEKVKAALMQSAANYSTKSNWKDEEMEYASEFVRLHGVRIVDEQNRPCKTIDLAQTFGVTIDFEVLTENHTIVPRIEFADETGNVLFWTLEVESEWYRRKRPPGFFSDTVWLPANFFGEGRLQLGVAIYSFYPWHVHFDQSALLRVEVVNRTGKLAAKGDFEGEMPGMIRPLLKWTSAAGKQK